MTKTKSAVKKEKTSTPKKVSASNKPSKPIKLGGVPNQGNVSNVESAS